MPHSGDSHANVAPVEAGWPVRGALLGIRAYKLLVSPILPGGCRYVPSCSDYAAEALARHGLLRGGWLALKRLFRCQPFGGAGLDPVPAPADQPQSRF